MAVSFVLLLGGAVLEFFIVRKKVGDIDCWIVDAMARLKRDTQSADDKMFSKLQSYVDARIARLGSKTNKGVKNG